MAVSKMELLELLRKADGADVDFLREGVRVLAQALMDAEVSAQIGAEHSQRTPERTTHRNGYRARDWDTRVGTVDLQIPRVREGSYLPSFLEPRRRAERALAAVVAQCYVEGVSTRRVEDIAQAMGITSLSKSQVSRVCGELDELVAAWRNRPLDAGSYVFVWLDALVVKVREAGRVVNTAALVATGVNAAGHREILGLELGAAEDGAAWTGFLRGLVARGLSGVKLVISDAHQGLKDAVAAVLDGAVWQRCRTHFMRINRPSGWWSSVRSVGFGVEPAEVALEAVGDALVSGGFGVPASGLGVVVEGVDVGELGLERGDELGCGLVVVALLADVGVGAGAGDLGARAEAVRDAGLEHLRA